MSDSWLFDSRLLDASRFSFTQALAGVSEAVCFFHANSFDGPGYEEELNRALTEFRPNIVIALNSGCLRESLFDYTEKNKIEVVTWFWDSPVLFGHAKSLLAKKSIVFLSDISYQNHGAFENTGEWMPFSSIPAVPYERKPSKDICFQGTLWSMTPVLNELALGLTCETNGKFYYGPALYTALTEGLDTASVWSSPSTGKSYQYGEILNSLSGLKRAKTLSWFANKELSIFGGDEWFTYLWNVAPELIAKVQYREVLTHKEMRALFGEHRCSLNIFHYQNKMGGPNLRILDSATHFTPILSDYNEYCDRLYPQGEAAVYFTNQEQAMEGLEKILHEPRFAEKLAKNAGAIVNAGHTHSHRIQTMFAKAQMAYEIKAQPATIQMISKTICSDMFEEGFSTAHLADNKAPSEFSFLSKADFDLNDRERLVNMSGPAKYHLYRLQLPGKLDHLRGQLEESSKRVQSLKIENERLQKADSLSPTPPSQSETIGAVTLLQSIKQRFSLMTNNSRSTR
jgi:spore maturation protein CgeB